MYGKKNILDFLIKGRGLYNKNILEYNPKTHPPIDERIKKIKGL